jgi:hypothetical protein
MTASNPTFAGVTKAVRCYRPSDVLPAVAAVASHIGERDQIDGWRAMAPWSLAAVARESLVSGNEHRVARQVTANDVLALNNLFVASHDGPTKTPMLLWVMAPLAYEQFSWQESDGEESLRSVVLFDRMWRQTPDLKLTVDDLAEAFGARSSGV